MINKKVQKEINKIFKQLQEDIEWTRLEPEEMLELLKAKEKIIKVINGENI